MKEDCDREMIPELEGSHNSVCCDTEERAGHWCLPALPSSPTPTLADSSACI